MRTRRRFGLTVLGVVAVALFWGGTRGEAGILYNQPPEYPPNNFNGLTSVTTPNGPTFQTFDNFELAQGGRINGITWQGLYWDFTTTQNNPPAPNTTSFQLSFYADNGGVPGALLSSQVLTNVTSQFVAPAVFGPDNQGNLDNVNVTSFNGTLSQPFLAPAGTPLWLSVVSNSTSFPPAFIWDSGTGGDGQSFQTDFFTGASSPQARDRTFALEGDVVGIPEPSSLSLLALGGLGLAGWRRWKRRATA
jgi:hypothetical protein